MALRKRVAEVITIQTESEEAEQDLDRIFGQAEQGAEVANKQMVRTTRASQEVVRIIQDLPFGLFGITNNIQALSEAWADMARKGISGTTALREVVGSLLRGPMAISLLVAVLTGLALHADKLAAAFREVAMSLNLINNVRLKIDRDAARSGAGSLLGTLAGDLDSEQADRLRERVVELRIQIMGLFRAFADRVNVGGGGPGAIMSLMTQILASTSGGRDALVEFNNALAAMGTRSKVTAREFEELRLELAIFEEASDSLTKILSERKGADILAEITGRVSTVIEEAGIALEDRTRTYREFITMMIDGETRMVKVFEESREGLETRLSMLDTELQEIRRTNRQRRISGEISFASEANLNRLQEERIQRLRAQAILEEEIARRRQQNAKIDAQATFDILELQTDLAAQRVITESEIPTNRREALSQELFRIEQETAEKRGELQIKSNAARLKNVKDLTVQEAALLFNEQEMLFNIEQDGQNKRLMALRKFHRQRFDIVIGSSKQIFGDLSSASQTFFNIWRDNRERELDTLGMTEQQKNSVLEKEGAKRFRVMKAIMIAEALANTFGAAVAALRTGSQVSPALGYISMAAAITAGLAQVAKIRAMRIGSTSAGSTSSTGIGRFTQLSASSVGDRAAQFGANQGSGKSVTAAGAAQATADIADRIGNIGTGTVVLHDKTAFESSRRVETRREKFAR